MIWMINKMAFMRTLWSKELKEQRKIRIERRIERFLHKSRL